MSNTNMAMQRIAAYIERRKKAHVTDVQCIHAFYLGPDGGFELLLSDIEALMAQAAPIKGWDFAIPADGVVVATRELSANETSTAVFDIDRDSVPHEFTYALALAVAKKEGLK